MELDIKSLKISVQPQVLAAIMKLKDEDTEMSFKDLEKYMKSDQNMAALVLKVANSPFYTRGNKIQTLEHAIAILGFKLVHSMAMVLSTKSIFAGGNYGRFRKHVWEHSVVTGIIARRVAEKKKKKKILEEVFVGGLLHDIGKAVLNAIDRKKFIQVLDKAILDNIPYPVAETDVFGIDHMQAGLQAAQQWNFPELFFPVIAYHENLDNLPEMNDDAKDILYLVAYANFVSNTIGFGHPNDEYFKVGEPAAKYLAITDEEQAYFTGKYAEDVKEEDLYKSFVAMV